MKNPEQLALLQEFYRDRLALMARHIEGAKAVSDYEFNNTYQRVIAREELHLQWVRDAIVDLGGEAPTTITRDPRPAWQGPRRFRPRSSQTTSVTSRRWSTSGAATSSR